MADPKYTTRTVQLPSEGRFNADGTKAKIEVRFKNPCRALTALALEYTKPFESRGDATLQTQAALMQLRVNLESIDGKPVNMAALDGNGIDRYLTNKQQMMLTKAFEKLTLASVADVNRTVGTVKAIPSKGEAHEHWRSFEMPTTEFTTDEDGVKKPVYKEVVVVLPTRAIMAAAEDGAQQFEQRSKLLMMVESSLNVLRRTVRSIDGRTYKYEDLRGDRIDNHLTQIQQSLIVQVMQRLMEPGEDEVSDFLSSLDATCTKA